jgi:hypothetical protein
VNTSTVGSNQGMIRPQIDDGLLDREADRKG